MEGLDQSPHPNLRPCSCSQQGPKADGPPGPGVSIHPPCVWLCSLDTSHVLQLQAPPYLSLTICSSGSSHALSLGISLDFMMSPGGRECSWTVLVFPIPLSLCSCLSVFPNLCAPTSNLSPPSLGLKHHHNGGHFLES